VVEVEEIQMQRKLNLLLCLELREMIDEVDNTLLFNTVKGS
jgi:hypothetical protein